MAWIGGSRRYDLAFFWLPPLLAMAAGLICVSSPAWVVLVWWLWLGLVDGPHFLSTWARVYLEPEERRKRGPLLAWSLLWFLPGFAALALAKATDGSRAFDLYLGFATVWAWHHYVRQHYGVLSIYERFARTPESWRRVDTAFLYVMLWGLFALYMVGVPSNRAVLGIPGGMAWLEAAVRTGLVAGGLIALGYAGSLAARHRQGHELRPALFLFCAAFVPSVAALLWFGRYEPLIPAPTNPEQFSFSVATMGGLMHGIPYLGIVFAVGKRRYADSPARTWAARLGRAPLLAYACLLLVSLAYLGINWVRSAAPGGPFAFDSTPARVAISIYWGIAMHHYYIDQKIWRPHADPELRRELGLVAT